MVMNRKEIAKMRRLEIRVEELEKYLDRAIDNRNDSFKDAFNATYAMRCAFEAIQEGWIL